MYCMVSEAVRGGKSVRLPLSRRLFLLVVAFSSLARILGECSTIYSAPALFFFLCVCVCVFFKWRLASAC